MSIRLWKLPSYFFIFLYFFTVKDPQAHYSVNVSHFTTMTPYDWFKFMMSIPRTEPMTKTELFTQWSCLVAYILGGCSFLFAPQLWEIILQFNLEGHSEGYLRLVGLGVIEIGLILMIAARSNHKMFRHEEILTSILGGLLLIVAILLMMILRKMLPLSFALFFMVLDLSLALITLVIWCQETEGASVSSLFREIFAPLLQCLGPKTGGSIMAIFYLGILQFFFWLVLTVRPDFAQQMFHLDSFQGYSSGFLAAYFFLVSIHGLYHVVGASNVNHCLSPVFVFYRILFSVPVYIVLFLVAQIERNLFIVLMVFDLIFSAVIFISLVRERSTKEEKSTEEESILNAEEKKGFEDLWQWESFM